MSQNDFSFLDDVDLVATFRSHKAACLIEGSSLGENVAIIPVKSFKEFFPWAVCYLPEEVKYLLSLDDESAKKVHLLKSRMGGFLEMKT